MGNSNIYSKKQWLPKYRNRKPESETIKETKTTATKLAK
jgi:hypothetical protein